MTKLKVEDIEPTQEETIAKEESESDNEQSEPVPKIETKATPKQKMTSCPNCGKEMLQKTFRYYHSLKCRPEEKEPIQERVRPEKIEVSFDGFRRVAQNENIKRLVSRAF